MKSALLAPLAALYGLGVSVRNKLFDWGWRRVRTFDIPLLCVGNITVGGTGKTPVVEMLIRQLRDTYNIAVLSRGYGRRTKGYLEVKRGMSYTKAGDEPKQIKHKFPDIVVVVCERRGEGIDRLREEHPEVSLIIMDDAFQHRQVEAWVNIVLVDYTRPTWQDHLLPWGMLRDTRGQMHRAHFVIVTKCPHDMNALERRIVQKNLSLLPYQGLYFCRTATGLPTAVFDDGRGAEPKPGERVVAMSGIGNPGQFEAGLARGYDVVGQLRYADHHPYRSGDLKDMQRALYESHGAAIITTEKDAVKLTNAAKIPRDIRENLYFQPIRVAFDQRGEEEDFITKLKDDLRTNPRERFLHSK